MMPQAVKCKVTVQKKLPNAKDKAIYNVIAGLKPLEADLAVKWIKKVGWGHVSGSDCTYSKCVHAKKFIKKMYVINKFGKVSINQDKIIDIIKSHGLLTYNTIKSCALGGCPCCAKCMKEIDLT